MTKSRDIVLEEMAKIMMNKCHSYSTEECNNCISSCYECEAAALYDEGYREESEVALKILDDIKKLIFEMRDFQNDDIQRGASWTRQEVLKFISHLENEYSED